MSFFSCCLHVAPRNFDHFRKPGTAELDGRSSSNLAVRWGHVLNLTVGFQAGLCLFLPFRWNILKGSRWALLGHGQPTRWVFNNAIVIVCFQKADFFVRLSWYKKRSNSISLPHNMTKPFRREKEGEGWSSNNWVSCPVMNRTRIGGLIRAMSYSHKANLSIYKLRGTGYKLSSRARRGTAHKLWTLSTDWRTNSIYFCNLGQVFLHFESLANHVWSTISVTPPKRTRRHVNKYWKSSQFNNRYFVPLKIFWIDFQEHFLWGNRLTMGKSEVLPD